MADITNKWDDVRSELEGLGLKLKMHVEQAGSDSAAAEEVGTAFKQLVQSFEGAVQGLGSAAQDDAVRQNVLELGRAFADAVNSSLNTLGQKFEEARK